MSYSKNRAIVLAVTEGAMTTSQAATHFNTSPRHIRRLLTQYRQHGLKGLEACWVLFRFLYWGQLADPCLIIHIDDVGWSVVSERFV